CVQGNSTALGRRLGAEPGGSPYSVCDRVGATLRSARRIRESLHMHAKWPVVTVSRGAQRSTLRPCSNPRYEEFACPTRPLALGALSRSASLLPPDCRWHLHLWRMPPEALTG